MDHLRRGQGLVSRVRAPGCLFSHARVAWQNAPMASDGGPGTKAVPACLVTTGRHSASCWRSRSSGSSSALQQRCRRLLRFEVGASCAGRHAFTRRFRLGRVPLDSAEGRPRGLERIDMPRSASCSTTGSLLSGPNTSSRHTCVTPRSALEDAFRTETQRSYGGYERAAGRVWRSSVVDSITGEGSVKR